MNDELAGGYARIGADAAPGARAEANVPSRIRAYLALILLLPLSFLGSAVPIVRSSSFPIEAEDPFLLNADYAFSLKDVNCDVVIVGDSTAVTGLDPTVVAGATGFKTCNIAQSRSALEIVGTLALDTYLDNNRAPRYIVMQFAPETLDRGRSDYFWPEGLAILLRQKSLPQALPFFALHPVQSYHFAVWAVKAKVRSLSRPPTDFGPTQAIFRSRGGLLILPKPPETRCMNHIKYGQPTAAWVRALREKYGRNGTRVLINISPLPDCAPGAQFIAESMQGVTDNAPVLYPIDLFCDLDRHLTLAGAERASSELARQLAESAHGGT